MEGYSESERLQKQHYDSIAPAYARHYGDTWSQAYRWRFINDSMFRNIDLPGLKVLDAMCGSGETTGYLLKRGAQVTGLDISGEAIRHFRARWPDCNAHCASILATDFKNDSFDCVALVGGLHHLHPEIFRAINEIHRIVRSGGHFCFVEPHEGSVADQIRQVWYKYDGLFAENESAVDVEALEREFDSKFKFIKREYKGNLAYLFVLNSMVFRIPLSLKPIYSPILLGIESMVEPFQGKRTSCVVVCQWMKR